MLEQDNIYKLICHTAQSDDSATYRCVATNPIGTVQSTCQVCMGTFFRFNIYLTLLL